MKGDGGNGLYFFFIKNKRKGPIMSKTASKKGATRRELACEKAIFTECMRS